MPDDLADILHQEIDRLPERHRIPVVLCDLEGRSHEEAARSLRCPVGTVKSRLSRARGRLRAALRRRGVGPSAVPARIVGNLAASWGSPPQGLTASTIRNSGLFATDPIRAAKRRLEDGFHHCGRSVESHDPCQTVAVPSLMTIAGLGLLVMAWFAHAGQAVVEPAQGRDAGGSPENRSVRTVDLHGNWIVRATPRLKPSV